MRLELISPCNPPIENHRDEWDAQFTSFLFGVKRYSTPYLALPTLAALTPSDIEISITDENVEEIDFDKNIDMVGITVPTFLVIRAYEIADEFRKRGITVILGGIHPSMLPEEAIQHADAVVIGEAENIWGELIDDYKKGNLQRFYRSSERPNLDDQPIPRWDLLKNELYRTHILQTTRGCPYDCEFCSVKAFLGKEYRCKSVSNVIKEVEALLYIGRKQFLFADDNFTGNKRRAKDLLQALTPYKINYYTQATLNIAKDSELLKLLAKSGCKSVFIGFESISEANIKQMNKGKSNFIKEYKDDIERIQSCGIGVIGSFIFGYDFDNESIFEETVNFVNSANLEYVTFYILTPFPGTKLFDRLDREGRILHKDWAKYNATYTCFKPKLMSPKALQDKYIWAKQQVYSYDSIFKRLRGLWNFWNRTNVRLEDRISPIIANLSGNDRAYNYLIAEYPERTGKVRVKGKEKALETVR
jgi:radical SAM superfamily enzyme YgiQ (UPF0313 family)